MNKAFEFKKHIVLNLLGKEPAKIVFDLPNKLKVGKEDSYFTERE